MPKDAEFIFEDISQEDIRKELLSKNRSEVGRYTYWTGLVLLGSFLVGLINAAPPRVADPAWYLNLIGLLLGSGGAALVGALLICLALVFNPGDSQLQNRAQLVRKAASWVALGWFLLIPLQIFTGLRLINGQTRSEMDQIEALNSVAKNVRNSNSEFELRAALAGVPNQPPIPPLTVPLTVAKSNVLAQLEKAINTAKNNQEQGASNRLQIWLKEVFRNTLQSVLLGIGYLAIGKHRLTIPFKRQALPGMPRGRR